MAYPNWLRAASLAGAIAAGVVTGCDSKQSTGTGSSGPTTAPSTVAPATQPSDSTVAPTTAPAATQPVTSTLYIDGQPFTFPGAQIRASRSNGFVLARLYSVDPKDALRDDYSGNSYDLPMHLDDIREPQMIFTSQWQFAARSHDYVDSNYGIFLDGMKRQLEPLHVAGKFIGDPTQVHFEFEGQFLEFQTADLSAQPKTVFVKGSLLAPVEYKD